MTIQHEYFILSEMHFRELLESQRKSAVVAKSGIMALDPIEIEKEYPNPECKDQVKALVGQQVYEYFKEAVFFHDDETLSKIKSLGFTKKDLSWFIPLEDLLEQFAIIRQNKIKIDSFLAFILIKGHLCLKFYHEAMKSHFGTIRDDIRMTEITKALVLHRNRRKYSGSDPNKYKSVLDFLLTAMINGLQDIEIFKQDKETFLDFSKGKTEPNILRFLLEDCFQYDETSMKKTSFFSNVFELFKLILPDRNLMDVETFDQRDIAYKSYNSYKAKTLKKIIYR